MIIRQLSIRGFKGLTLDLKPELPLVEITGPNRSGKTTILEAISILTIGRHIGRCPKANTRTNAIMRSMGPAEWSLAMETDLGSASYKVTPDIITHESDLPEVNIEAVRDFMDLSGPNRSRALVAAAGGTKYESELDAYLKRAKEMEVEPLGETIIERAMSTIEQLKGRLKHARAALTAIPQQHEPDVNDPQRDYLADDVARLANARVDLTQKTAAFQAWASIADIEDEEGGPTVDEARIGLEKATRHRDRLQNAATSLDSKIRSAHNALGRLPRPMIWDPEECCTSCGAKSEHWNTTEADVDEHNKGVMEQGAKHAADIKAAEAERDLLTPDQVMANEAWAKADGLLRSCLARDGAIERRNKAKTNVTEEELDGLQADIMGLEETVNDRKLAAHAWDQYRRSEATRAELSAIIEPIAALIKEMNAWLKDVGQRVFTDVLELGNQIVARAIGVEFQFHKGDFVYWKDGIMIPYDGMSGSERALCGLALSMGLQLREGARIVFLDEFHVFDEDVRDAILSQLYDMTKAGWLDMAWIVEPKDGGLEIDGKA